MLFDYFNNVTFAQPLLLWLLIIIPFLIGWYIKNHNSQSASLKVSTVAMKGLQSFKTTMRHIPFIFRLLALSFIILALARPQTKNDEQRAEGEGIDIILCIDVSGSMTARDFQPNRLEAAKEVAFNFAQKRLTDRIGIVIFSGESFTLCPLTTDKAVLLSAIKNIRNGLLEDGTAIGAGLSTSVDRLRNSGGKSKVVLLLTDGVNNGGLIDPKTAKEIAKAFEIKVYTIGVGSDGYAQQPVNTPLGVVMESQKVNIDENLMTEIAVETGGKYYRARDNQSLNAIYANIDKLERSKVEIINTIRYQEKFYPFAIAALFFILLEALLRYTLFRKFP
ncbi:MAG: VWA domain-containing protein [Ferruginibacter sp.]